MPTLQTQRLVYAAIPYIAVIVGLYLLQSAWWSVCLYQAGMAACIIVNRKRIRISVFSGWHWRVGVLTSLAFASAGIIRALLSPWISRSDVDFSSRLVSINLAPEHRLVFLIYFVAITPLLEEGFWRGFLGPNSRRPSWTDAAFAGYHLLVLRMFLQGAYLPVAFAVLFLTAWLWRALARTHNGLAIPIVTHIVADISLLASAIWLAQS